jgi:anaerobic selenocysteine-containing dehydrogenase
VEAGRITDVAGDSRHPFTRGVICGKVHDYAERVYGPTRVLTPLRRVGPKGEGRFEPIGWDEAVDEIAHRWRRVIAQWGAEAILPFSYGGTLGLVQNRGGHALFYALGASRLDRTICVSTAYAGWQGTLGTVTGNDSEQMVDSELIVLWGINASHTHINAMTLVKQARRRGAFVVCVDPYRTPTARLADWHLMPRPGTDGALALGVMHVLIGEGRVDQDYIQRATLGFTALAQHVKQYDPERVAAITGLDAPDIVAFAHRYGATRAAFIRVGIGLSRHDNGGMTCRTIACLPALTGAYAHPAGGALLASSSAFGLSNAADEDPHACALYFYTEPGDHMGYHYDTSYYRGARYTVLLGLVQDSSSRLQCRLHTRQPGRAPVDLAVATEPGALVVFNGDKVYHGVSPAQEGERRVVYTMEYVTSQEMGRVQRLYSNLKDAVAYFGIRALLRDRGRTRARQTRVQSES